MLQLAQFLFTYDVLSTLSVYNAHFFPSILIWLIVASLSEPHCNVENNTVVHVRRTVVKNGIATHYYSLVRWFMYKQTR